MVPIVFFPVTVARMFTAPYFFISGQKPLAAATASPTFPSNSQTVKETTIFLSIFVKCYNSVYLFTDLSKITLRNLKSKCRLMTEHALSLRLSALSQIPLRLSRRSSRWASSPHVLRIWLKDRTAAAARVRLT